MTRLYAANLAYTTLEFTINSTVTSFTVIDATNFPDNAPFIVKCESEIMLVGAIDKVTRTFSSVTRGYESTTAASHNAATTISNLVTAGYLNGMFDYIDGKVDSTGGAITGNVTIAPSSGSTAGLTVGVTGDLTVTGDITIATSSGSTAASILDMSSHTIKDPVISGGSLADEFDANDKVLGKPVIKNYKETVVELNATGSTAAIALNLLNGNIFKVTQTGAIAGIDVTNASTLGANSLTLDILSNSSTYSIAWMAAYSVITGSTKVSASTVDDSFNCASTAFGANVEAGDIITVTGFSTGSSGLNDSWRVKSATTTKITVVDDSSAIVTKAAGDSVTITRRQEFFTNTNVPAAPTAYTPKVFTLWSYKDTTRWRISEVGDF